MIGRNVEISPTVYLQFGVLPAIPTIHRVFREFSMTAIFGVRIGVLQSCNKYHWPKHLYFRTDVPVFGLAHYGLKAFIRKDFVDFNHFIIIGFNEIEPFKLRPIVQDANLNLRIYFI